MKNENVFSPYYINQQRLLDMYSILNGGYAEYEEISNTSQNSTKSNTKGGVSASAGFKLIKISSEVAGEIGDEDLSGSSISFKRVQTIPSILSKTITQMSENKMLCDFDVSKIQSGKFINMELSFKLNSVKYMFEEIKRITELAQYTDKITKASSFTADAKKINELEKLCVGIINDAELYCEVEDYAVIATINDHHLYLSNIEDLLNTPLKCFAQVRKIYPCGTALLKNTLLSKLKNKQNKENFMSVMMKFTNNNEIEWNSEVKFEILDKPVVEVEIISLVK